MTLTWLKRVLREPGYPSYEDAQDLLDVIDTVYEDAQASETKFLQVDEEVDPHTEMSRFVKRNAKILVSVLIRIPSIGMQGVLDAMIASQGYEELLHELEEWKKRPHEPQWPSEAFLEDPDHPF